jgi:hypothetical protein
MTNIMMGVAITPTPYCGHKPSENSFAAMETEFQNVIRQFGIFGFINVQCLCTIRFFGMLYK